MRNCCTNYRKCVEHNTSGDVAHDIDCAIEFVGCVKPSLLDKAAPGNLDPAQREQFLEAATKLRELTKNNIGEGTPEENAVFAKLSRVVGFPWKPSPFIPVVPGRD